MRRKVYIKYSQTREGTSRIDREVEILLGDILKPRVCLLFYGALSPFSATNGIGQTSLCYWLYALEKYYGAIKHQFVSDV